MALTVQQQQQQSIYQSAQRPQRLFALAIIQHKKIKILFLCTGNWQEHFHHCLSTGLQTYPHTVGAETSFEMADKRRELEKKKKRSLRLTVSGLKNWSTNDSPVPVKWNDRRRRHHHYWSSSLNYHFCQPKMWRSSDDRAVSVSEWNNPWNKE